MEADYLIELGPDDAVLEIPWAAPQPGPRFIDLRNNPAAISEIEEAARYPELAGLLAAINSRSSPLQSAKCDVWYTTDLGPEDEIFRLPGKFGSYVDLVFVDATRQSSFEAHEELAKRVTDLLKRAPEIPSSVELLVRRCFVGEQQGFYITAYCFGYGTDESAARRQWSIALKLVETSLRQATAGAK